MSELFEAFDDDGASLGLVPRETVHQLGLWHRSVHIILHNYAGEMLLQRRSLDKDLYGGLWDYAVGEHLKPGESFDAGAARGLQEELGVEADVEKIGEIRA